MDQNGCLVVRNGQNGFPIARRGQPGSQDAEPATAWLSQIPAPGSDI